MVKLLILPMKYIDEYYDKKVCRTLTEKIERKSKGREIVLMEVCGTHTMSIFRNGIKDLLPENIRVISGPGCPVCVTPNSSIDQAIALSRLDGVCITTFGDMMKVPGSSTSLIKERGRQADVRIVYSPTDAVKIAEQNPDKMVIFLGIGFETTAPIVASSLIDAFNKGLENYFILPSNKLIPPAIKSLLESGETKIDGFLLPGHVSVIIGIKPYQFISEDYNVSGAIAGFEPVDIMYAIHRLVEMIVSGSPAIENCYKRTVKSEGNIIAKKLMEDVFEVCSSEWRGLGIMPESGLGIKNKYKRFDAIKNIQVDVEETKEHTGCLCGDVLRGVVTPLDCLLFGSVCKPENPVGPCMVSTEGTCAAYYRYADYRR